MLILQNKVLVRYTNEKRIFFSLFHNLRLQYQSFVILTIELFYLTLINNLINLEQPAPELLEMAYFS